ncbi:hypothetical protein AB0395_37335 [Streptosporangium sp. NPDC051023]|uniref:hypothetical protein n=1 Tax=Streptosporangium sp. NPDC051023 TaxID=3155410 RepID=UPI00344BD2DD
MTSSAVSVGASSAASGVLNLNSSPLAGAARVGEAAGDLPLNSPSGDIVVERAYGALTAKSASGAVGVGEVFLRTYAGNREVGIREGTPAGSTRTP